MPIKRRTNVQIVRDLMEFSDHGALAQMFVMEAIKRYADQVAAMDPDKLRACFEPMPFLNADSWQGVAKEIRQKIADAYAD